MKLRGWLTDTLPQNSPSATWRAAENIVVRKRSNSISNEDGFNLQYTVGQPVIGITPTDRGHIIFSTDGHLKDEIGFYDKNTNVYTAKVTGNNIFNFKFNKPIECVYQYNALGELVIVFTDNNTNFRIINLDDVPVDLNKTLFFPNIKHTFLDLNLMENYGKLKSGAYYFTFRYRNANGNVSSYQHISNPFFIVKANTSVGYNKYEGCEANSVTSQAIQLSLTDVDTSFDFIDIVIIKKIGGVKTAEIVNSLNIDGISTNLSYVYTGSENVESVDLTEILTASAVYTKVKTLAIFNNNLEIGNLESTPDFEYQKYANNIKVNFTITNENDYATNIVDSSKSKTLNFTRRTFMPREVYALFIAFKLKKGGYSRAYHIPGREVTVGEQAASTLTNTGFGTMPKVYQIEETEDVPTNKMAAWLNQNEYYPDASVDTNGNWEIWDNTGQIGTLQGENIRHHKMPSIAALRRDAADTTFWVDYVPSIGLEVSDVYIPTEIDDQIEGWEIFYAERDLNNTTVFGQDNIIYAGKEGSLIHSRGMNYHFKDNTGATTNTINDTHWNILKGNCFDLLLNKPDISPSFIATEIKLTQPTAYPIVMYNNRITDITGQYHSIDPVSDEISSSKLIRAINSFKYVPAHIVDGDIQNYKGQEHIQIELADSTENLIGASTTFNSEFAWEAGLSVLSLNTAHVSGLLSYCALRDDIYVNFNNLSLVSTGKLNTGSTATVNGGDCFLNDWFYVTGLRYWKDTYSKESVQAGFRMACIATSNIALRYEDSEDIYTRYYPKTTWDGNIGLVDTPDFAANHFAIKYNNDYSSINNLNPVFPFNSYVKQSYKFPFRVAKATAVNTESTNSYFGTFLANNYYTMPKNKGEVWKLESFDRSLIVSLKNALFLTSIVDKLATNSIEIYTGTGDIFDRLPTDIIPNKLGYVGNQCQFASIISKIGFLSIDKEQGKVFTLSQGGIKEISNFGKRNYFIDKLELQNKNLDNPFMEQGFTALFDERMNRLIISKRDFSITGSIIDFEDYVLSPLDTIVKYNGCYYRIKAGAVVKNTDKSISYQLGGGGGAGDGHLELMADTDSAITRKDLTVSFDISDSYWIGKHIYNPNFMFSDRDDIYFLQNTTTQGKVFIGNQENKKAVYFDTTKHESYVDLMLNNDTPVMWESIKWESNVSNSSGQDYENKTVTKIFVYNKNQCTQVFTIKDNGQLKNRLNGGNSRDNLGKWSFNDLRDYILNSDNVVVGSNDEILTANIKNNKRWFDLNRIVSSYIVIRFIYDNVDQNDFYLNDVTADGKQK